MFLRSLDVLWHRGLHGSRIVGDRTFSWLVKGWKAVEGAGDRVLLMQIHGANCGGTNLRRCYEAVAWADDHFASVRPTE